MATQASKAISSALTLLAEARKTENPNGENSSASDVKTGVLPTAKTRSALDLLTNSSLDYLLSNEVNLRELAQNLFNWSETPKATKNVMRELNVALQTPEKYAHAIELTAYIVALVPLLEPDRLARLFNAIKEVDTCYAPARYTLQLSSKLSQLLNKYPEDRREKLAYSLWVEAHQGRWWDLTAGETNQPVAPAVNEVEVEEISDEDFIKLFMERNLVWSTHIAAQARKIAYDVRIVETLDGYNNDLLDGKHVDPDLAVIASNISWLEPLQRPESPIGHFVDTLLNLVNQLDYVLPEKPKTFSEMFPNIRMYGGATFPFPNSILSQNGRVLNNSIRLELVSNATALADNRTEMGNCTYSYKGRMEKGEYVLFRVHSGGHVYNGSLILTGNERRWRLGELNSRFNRGNVPANVRATFEEFIRTLPPVAVDNEILKQIEQYKQMQRIKTHKYKYGLD